MPSTKFVPLIKINKQKAVKKKLNAVFFKIISRNSNFVDTKWTSSKYKKNITMINCDNNLLVGDTSILRSDRIPTIKILNKNNFITKFKLIKEAFH